MLLGAGAIGAPWMVTRRTAASSQMTGHEGSNSERRALNLAERGCAWWLLWRLSPPVIQASTRELNAVLSKFLPPRR